MSGSEPKQRLVDLDVGEVSIVDVPANEEPFVMTKAAWSTAFINDLPDSSFLYIEPGGKKDEDGKTTPRSLRHFPYKDGEGKVDMPHLNNALSRIPQSNLPDDVKAQATARAQHAKEEQTVNKAVGVMLDPSTATYATLNAMRDCIYRLGDKLRDPSDLDEAKAEIERIRAMLDSAQEFATMVNKAMTEITAEVTKAKGDGKKMPAFMKEQMSKLLETIKAAMGDGEPDADDETKKTEKALETISKAGKAQFSKERMAKLHDAFVHMGTMYKEADAAAFQKAVEAWTAKPATSESGGGAVDSGGGTTGTNTGAGKPATPANGSAVKAGESVGAEAPAWFTKSMEDIQKSITEVKETTQAVSKRVEKVEKVEAVSKALGEDRDDNTNKVQKSNGKQPSIFKGII